MYFFSYFVREAASLLNQVVVKRKGESGRVGVWEIAVRSLNKKGDFGHGPELVLVFLSFLHSPEKEGEQKKDLMTTKRAFWNFRTNIFQNQPS